MTSKITCYNVQFIYITVIFVFGCDSNQWFLSRGLLSRDCSERWGKKQRCRRKKLKHFLPTSGNLRLPPPPPEGEIPALSQWQKGGSLTSLTAQGQKNITQPKDHEVKV